MKLSTRLQTVYDMVPFGVAYDVGSDHGKLIISLVENNKILFGYGGENKTGPFTRLKEEMSKSSKLNKLKPLLNDGINDLPLDVNILLLCGMGGYLINDILNKNKQHLSHVDHIIIDAHNAIYEVRENLSSLGYQIDNEQIVYENKIYYEIIHFVKGEKQLDELDKCFGPILRRDKSLTFINKWTKRSNEIDRIINKIDDKKRIDELKEEKERIGQVL